MNNTEDIIINKEFERFTQAISRENNLTMLILKAHLFTENLLERLINHLLPRGDRIIETGNLTYHQKLILVDSLDCLPDSIISSLRNLNKLRNLCAHELDKQISTNDITKIGSPLGKIFTNYKRKAKLDEEVLLNSVISYICGFVTAKCYMYENEQIEASESSD